MTMDAPEREPEGLGVEAAADVLVVFGITGDLARVMTFHSLYRLEQRGLLSCPIVGVAVDAWTVDQLADHARGSIVATGETLDEAVFARLRARLSYVQGDFADPSTYLRVGETIKGAVIPVFYLEIPPFLFATLVKGLAEAGLTGSARIVVEKPFGHDRASARALAEELHRYVDESQLYRIDHYLGKMGLEEMVYLRFANRMLEPIWNENNVACVQITLAEDFGVEGRGRFYEPVGALRDVVVNHLMQVVAVTAMEPPAGGEPKDFKDAMVRRPRRLRRNALACDPRRPLRGTTAAPSLARPSRRCSARGPAGTHDGTSCGGSTSSPAASTATGSPTTASSSPSAPTRCPAPSARSLPSRATTAGCSPGRRIAPEITSSAPRNRPSDHFWHSPEHREWLVEYDDAVAGRGAAWLAR